MLNEIALFFERYEDIIFLINYAIIFICFLVISKRYDNSLDLNVKQNWLIKELMELSKKFLNESIKLEEEKIEQGHNIKKLEKENQKQSDTIKQMNDDLVNNTKTIKEKSKKINAMYKKIQYKDEKILKLKNK